MRATIIKFYTAGHRRLATGAVHQYEGDLTVTRQEGRFGTVPVMVLNQGGSSRETLFEPRIVDMVGFKLVISGLERAADGAWVAQQWWVEVQAGR